MKTHVYLPGKLESKGFLKKPSVKFLGKDARHKGVIVFWHAGKCLCTALCFPLIVAEYCERCSRPNEHLQMNYHLPWAQKEILMLNRVIWELKSGKRVWNQLRSDEPCQVSESRVKASRRKWHRSRMMWESHSCVCWNLASPIFMKECWKLWAWHILRLTLEQIFPRQTEKGTGLTIIKMRNRKQKLTSIKSKGDVNLWIGRISGNKDNF